MNQATMSRRTEPSQDEIAGMMVKAKEDDMIYCKFSGSYLLIYTKDIDTRHSYDVILSPAQVIEFKESLNFKLKIIED